MSHTNAKSAWVDGNLYFYDKSSAVIAVFDGTNRLLSNPSTNFLITTGASSTDNAGRTIRLNSITNTGTGNSFIGFQSKPRQGASMANNVIGCEISAQISDAIALTSSGSLIGAHVDTFVRGTTGDIGGDVRGLQVEMVTDDAGARTITGNVSAIRIRSAFSATTISGKFIPIRIEKAEAQTNSKNYDAVLELTGTSSLAWHDTDTATGDTEAGYFAVYINGNKRYVQCFSDAPSA